MNKVDIIMPVVKDDALKVLKNYKILRKYLSFDNLILIGNEEVKNLVKELNDSKVKFKDENKLLPDGNLNYQSIKKLIEKRNGNGKRAGWYLQQFLKLGYSYMCKNEYYIVWDSDTVPLKKVDFFNKKGQPYFDMKTEYHKPYFDTIKVLFNDKYEKAIPKSFISEHMVFKTKYVQEMLSAIENNENISGDKFYEKIINAIVRIQDLNNSGFAEFETYGTYIYYNHKEDYELRSWKSLREGIFYFPLPLNSKQINWLAKEYNAVSFEKHDTLSKLYKLWNNDFIYNHCSIKFIQKITYPYMQIRKIIKMAINR